MPVRSKLPKYSHHKATGQARVWLDGRDHYLGPYDSEESRERYRELIDAWQLRVDDTRPLELTVGELVLLYLAAARKYYRKHGRPTSEVACIEAACRFLKPHRRRRADGFGPRVLEAVRAAMIREGLARTTINSQVGRIRRLFRWGVARELVDPGVLTSISALAPLKAGRSEARETDPVQPVDDEHVDAVLPLLTDPLRALAEILRLTAARTGDLKQMRTGDIDRSVEPWEYRPRSHKTEHKGKKRLILLGPKSQAIILPLLRADPEAFVFRPGKDLRRRYHPQSLRNAIQRACRSINEERAEKDLPPMPIWHPHQLRHTAGTRIRKDYGIEIAQTALGHSKPDMTEHYAERDLAAYRRMALEIG